jgi:hypothetical protein
MRYLPGAQVQAGLYNPTLTVMESLSPVFAGQVLTSASLYPTLDKAMDAAVKWADRLEALDLKQMELAR